MDGVDTKPEADDGAMPPENMCRPKQPVFANEEDYEGNVAVRLRITNEEETTRFVHRQEVWEDGTEATRAHCIVYSKDVLFQVLTEACSTSYWDELVEEGVSDCVLGSTSYMLPPSRHNLLFVSQEDELISVCKCLLAHKQRKTNQSCTYKIAIIPRCSDAGVEIITRQLGGEEAACAILENMPTRKGGQALKSHQLRQREQLSLKVLCVPLETDLYTMRMPDLYRDITLTPPGSITGENPGRLAAVAEAIFACEEASQKSLNQVKGQHSLISHRKIANLTPSIKTKGDLAGVVGETLLRLRKKHYPYLDGVDAGCVHRCTYIDKAGPCRRNAMPTSVGGAENHKDSLCFIHAGWYADLDKEAAALPEPAFDHLVIFERAVDRVSPMLCQHTYSGLIDEIYGSEYNLMQQNAEQFSTLCASKGLKLEDLCFNSADPVWEDLRDLPFLTVGDALKKQIQEANATQQDMEQNLAKMKVSELKRDLSKVSGVAEKATKQDYILPMLQAHQVVINHLHKAMANQNPEDGMGGRLDCQLVRNVFASHPLSKLDLMLFETVLHKEAVYENQRRRAMEFFRCLLNRNESSGGPYPLIPFMRLVSFMACSSHGMDAADVTELEQMLYKTHGYRSTVLLHNMRFDRNTAT